MKMTAIIPTLPTTKQTLSAVTFSIALLIGGCGAGTGDDLGSGNPIVPSPIDPMVGVYDITGSWNGRAADEARLVIREPGIDGTAEVALYDFDEEQDNCYFRPSIGEAKKEIAGNRIFLDNIVQFDDAVLSLSGDTLTIEFFDTLDSDNDNNTGEVIRYSAPRIAVTEMDLVPGC
ncbi:MAG: hypothetical protein V3U76_02055 [Granulosicoccus sp.]